MLTLVQALKSNFLEVLFNIQMVLLEWCQDPDLNQGQLIKIMKKHYLCLVTKGKCLNMVPSKKLPYHFHTSNFFQELFFVSHLRVIGMEVLGDLVTSEIPEVLISGQQSLMSCLRKYLQKKIFQGEAINQITSVGIFTERFRSIDL